MVSRALFLLAVMPAAVLAPAHAQSGGIQVAPVTVEMSQAHSFASLRIGNGRVRPVAFEADVYAWRQIDGEDVLSPTNALLVAPGVFEIAPGGEQVVRLAAPRPDPSHELAFRLILRELPSLQRDGTRLGFTLEMSLPVFVTPSNARAEVRTQTLNRPLGTGLVLHNAGAAHAQILSLDDIDAGALAAPRYLLAGATAEVALSARTRSVRMRLSETSGEQAERIVHVATADNRSPGR